ncbi:unnamed protein product [Protopolystoma xenopodis]|uniref:Uncharacterized protein n=1 Tax=Protopolystoma xenopodis TaxID=117903 RepID=A0A448WL22_9PLAT|nr:unnamed protein product [Protopolystoma xenopodis]
MVPPSTTTIDVTGSLILPGGLDYFNYFLHDDFNKFVEFSKETLIDGTTCAVLTLICPPGISPAKLSKSFLSASEVNRPLCDFALRVGMCEIQETTLKEMEEMVRCLGIISFLVSRTFVHLSTLFFS